jgi:LmbE family N-acetylglucosaminyl deacetylase
VTAARLAPFPDDWSRGLAVVAHPDDLEYGSASAIARWTSEGREITYLLVTRGEAGIDAMAPEETATVRAEEERRSAAVAGVAVVEFLDGHHDGVVEYGLPLRRDLAAAFRRRRPEVLISINHRDAWPGGWLNMADHRNVGLAILDAVRDAGNRWVFPELLDDGLEPWAGIHRVAFNASPDPTHALDVTGFLDRGIASLAEHRAYLAGLGDGATDPDAMLRGAAEAAGERFGVEHAVEFEVLQL